MLWSVFLLRWTANTGKNFLLVWSYFYNASCSSGFYLVSFLLYAIFYNLIYLPLLFIFLLAPWFWSALMGFVPLCYGYPGWFTTPRHPQVNSSYRGTFQTKFTAWCVPGTTTLVYPRFATPDCTLMVKIYIYFFTRTKTGRTLPLPSPWMLVSKAS